jgi:autotransporter-associated beta strand protein
VNFASGNNNIQISSDNQPNMQIAFNMNGGTVNLGTGSSSINSIWFYKNGVNSGGGGTATFTQTGGVVNAWGGIQFGIASGTVINSGTAALTNSGGFLYIGPGGSIGISKFANAAATNYITLSGGTVGALGAWISSMPMTLATLNGNITFQTADSGGNQFNIGLSGALTGPGGFNKTGGGTLTLSGANNYSGSTVVSNGILKIVPTLSPTNGSLTLDGSAFSPVLSLVPSSVPQSLTLNGNLTFAAGTMTADFNFSGFTPSTTIAPIQVGGSGNVAFTATPQVTVEGTAIPVGTYPLIQYTGAVSGTPPTTPTSLPASTSGYITNIVATKTIALVVTSSPITADYVWAVGSGNWDFVTKNWIRLSVLTNYTDVAAAAFNDTASGPFPITITNTTTVTPPAVKVTSTNGYTISGPGTIAGASTTVTKAGNGALTLTGTNTYAGGTTVIGGQLNINFGGSSSLNSAIGTGPLTLDLGSKVDNTSGQSVTLQPTIAQNWLDDWTYLGSTNFDTGIGTVTLGSSIVTLNVVSNTLAVSGPIGDGGNTYKIQKSGNGTLTLRVNNSFAGGFELVSGQVNLGSANCLGNGIATFDGGTVDNVSGADLTLSGVASYSFPVAVNGTWTYLGTSNNLDLGSGQVAITTGASQNWNIVSNTLTLEGNLAVGNATITKIGSGTLAIIGTGTASQASFIVNQGELDAGRSTGVTFGNGGSGHGFQVQSNAVVKILPGGDNDQIINGAYNVPILNAGGVLDLNGQSEIVDGLSLTNGVLRNSANGSAAVLYIVGTPGAHPTNTITLNDVNNRFDVPLVDGTFNIDGIIDGSGSLVKTGLGTLSLIQSNYYTGNTTISDGTLILNFPFLATNSTVTVSTNATLGTNGVLNLNFANSETNVVTALILGGVSKPAGVYNNGTDPLYITGTGSLQLGSATPPINPLPGPIQFSISGSTLALSWPTNLGWILQSQTNALNVGLVVNSNAWFDISGSSSVTSTNYTLNPANPTVFFRLRLP